MPLSGYLLWRLCYPAVPIAGMLLLAFSRPRAGARWFHAAERRLNRLAKRRGRAVVLVGLLSFTLCAASSLLVRMPQPAVNDEFSYLLAADTFAHGRLTNPTHPLWVHFESMHILQQPSYASKYPPGQGLFLALGQAVTGRPIAGAWLTTALACAALCWMLMAWLPARWALMGGLLAAVHPTMLEWSQNCWGGSVAMLGGALTMGAFRRLWHWPRPSDAWWLGLGLALLANSRPFEGGLLGLLLFAALLLKVIKRQGPSLAALLKHAAAPVVVVLALTAGAVGYYNRRVTGSALRLPYAVHEATYAVAPPFLWQRPRPEPVYRHRELRDFYVGYALQTYLAQRSVKGFFAGAVRKLRILAAASLRLLAVAVSLVAVPLAVRKDRWARLALTVCALFTAALLAETWMLPHYAAPAVGLVFALALAGLRYLRLWRCRGRRVGRFLVRASLLLSFASVVVTCAQFSRVEKQWAWAEARARLLADLESDAERHLVIVRYGPQHTPHQEWVYNEAEIDGAKVVWAREMDEAHNRQLLGYFAGRRVWLLEADAPAPRLLPYPVPPDL